MDDIIARIKHKLAYLQQYDEALKHEGSSKAVSRYIVYRRYTEDEIATFEAEHGIRLPEDYRRFIIEIGTDGFHIGPSSLDRKYKEGFLKTPFDFNQTMTYEDTDQLSAERGYGGTGYLEVTFAGCTCYYSVIVSGEQHGKVWYVDDTSFFTPVFLADGQIYHHHSGVSDNVEPPPHAYHATFTQWYEAKLDEDIHIAQEHWRKRGRDVPPLDIEND